MIDTHAHLDALEGEAGAALERARAAGVERVVAVGSGIESCQETLQIAEREPGVFAALGIHPHQAGDVSDDDLRALDSLLWHERTVAVGETGLDYYRDYAPRVRQQELFATLVARACERRLPIVVHSRAADEDTARLLLGASQVPVILHCFSSTGLLRPALDNGWYVSFAGNLTYPKAGDLRTAAAQVPADRLLAETDSPYLSPQPVRGQRNEPANVVHTLRALAEARGQDPGELEQQIEANGTAAFRLP